MTAGQPRPRCPVCGLAMQQADCGCEVCVRLPPGVC